ncbi:MAG: PIG-L family deacetylase [Chloroflexi bacterium]|nr:PIG-L family deacetylase [Chloroflexota bacterium]MBV9543145.1 PIG-L family deacetylase [Chloroflexota bacterium]
MATYLVVAAHPDDADFGVAGTAAKLARDGHAVHYLLCTRGEAGSDDQSVLPEILVETRETEQREAGRILGLASVQFLDFPDGELEPSLALRKAIVRCIRALRADVIVCQDPRMLVDEDGTYLNHPDHRAAGQAAVDAAFPAAGNPKAHPDLLAEGLQPHKVREVWLFFTGANDVNHWVDITDTIDQKIDALAAHASQIGEWAASGGLRTEMLKWGSETAKRHALEFEYAEVFQRIVLQSEEPPEAQALDAQNA